MSVPASQVSARQNQLLAAVPPREIESFRACLARVPLARGQVLAERGQPLDHALFIEHGAASVVSDAADDADGVQVAMIGREGMVGGLSLLGLGHPAFGKTVVQMPGTALRIGLPDLRRAIERSPALDEACTRFTRSLIDQVVQTATCNARRSLAERCARWLVLAHDRAEGDELRVTHEALSSMLGVRRAGVTVAVAALQQAGLIKASRGRITVLDRAGLQGFARGAGHAVPPVPPARADRPRGALRLPEQSVAF